MSARITTPMRTSLWVAAAFSRFNARLGVGLSPDAFARMFDAALFLVRDYDVWTSGNRLDTLDAQLDAINAAADAERIRRARAEADDALFTVVADGGAEERFEALLNSLDRIYPGDAHLESLEMRWREWLHDSQLATVCAHCGADISMKDEFTREMGFCDDRCCGEYGEAHPEEA